MKKAGTVSGVVELATFLPLAEAQRQRIEEMVKALAEKINS
jgi:hypothetical protein